ncbi:hypothetical protein AVEN_191025-1 [Araneus ventricosus]|uniref:Uncharacterized protein n=1 Tax=Araneus ventricosus TaxID=182803 RepID=A0A4Y2W1F8_ARAVE|nr:hypothetical protein AVEN_191025-1 [Araneus ventricosus]
MNHCLQPVAAVGRKFGRQRFSPYTISAGALEIFFEDGAKIKQNQQANADTPMNGCVAHNSCFQGSISQLRRLPEDDRRLCERRIPKVFAHRE